MPATETHKPSRPRLRRLLLVGIVCFVTMAGIIGIGSIRTRTSEAQGRSLDGPPLAVTPSSVFRVGTMNIHGGTSPSGADNLAQIAETIRGLDLIALQEVRDTPSPGTPPQAQSIAQLLEKDWLFAPSERQYFSGRFGNGVVASLPVTSWQQLNLPSLIEHSRRNVLILKAEPLPARTVTFLLTHIARHEDQQAQLDYVSKLFLEQKPPVILMGDFNATSDNPQIAELLATPGVLNPLDRKHPDLRGKHIDWILVRGLDIRDAGLRDLGASDHPMAWAELAFPSPLTRPTQPADGILHAP